MKNRSDFEKSYFHDGTKDTLSNGADAALPGKRRLTFIYYLNEPPTATDVDVGGKLRVYNVPRQTNEKVKENGESFMDIAPALGTLVVFRRCVCSKQLMHCSIIIHFFTFFLLFFKSYPSFPCSVTWLSMR